MLQGPHDLAGEVAHVVAVHAADEADQAAGAGKGPQQALPLAVQFRLVDAQQAHIIGAQAEAEGPQFAGIQ